MSRLTLYLLRHTAVAAGWQGRCYGRAEAGLSAEGCAAARAIAAGWQAPVAQLISSPARRARLLAGLLARQLSLPLRIEPRLAERDFGGWEGQRWDAVFQATGNAMDGMITAPSRFRPDGGETTAELAARARAWCAALPAGDAVLAVAHGGPIAALLGSLLDEAPRAWMAHVPRPGGGLMLELAGSGTAQRLLRHLPLPPPG